MPAEPVISVRGLRKAYGTAEAVRGIDLDVHAGEVVALLGPNGAGKTTTVEILEGYRGRTTGDVRVLGHDPAHGEPALRDRIGIVLQSTGVERHLTAREAVALYACYYRRPRPAAELLAHDGLADAGDVRVGRLSGGQRRRLDLAIALVGSPDLVFLDEPTTGFDPSARRSAWDLIRDLAAAGTTILLTTHFMDEAQVLADRLAVLVDGRIVAEGSPDAVIATVPDDATVSVRLPDGVVPPAETGLVAEPGIPGRFRARVADPAPLLHRLTGWSLAEGVPLTELTVTRPTLEETYLALTGHAAEAPSDAPAPAAAGRRRRR
ncbi:MAG: ABC transporter ATP-binding protein [Chloroflexota bacterium]